MNLFNEYEKTLRKTVARIRFRRWVSFNFGICSKSEGTMV